MLLQIIDSFLLNYNVGQALLLGFVVLTLGALPLGSRRILGINFIVFGLVFALTPTDLVPVHYLFLGITLMVIGPMLYVTASE
ncbi:hypothetical protein [Haloprofundus salinisoli]|uniref:hypothetical protein n=1 Tax=Haloprofundus salinisoli TaxID=2876193 RepID=UPI001CCA612F|nr:hypothetical protein [Haloprofundus salinisoli]